MIHLIILILLHRLEGKGYLSFDRPDAGQATGYHQQYTFSNAILGLLIDKKKYTYPAHSRWIGFKPNYVNGPAYGGLISDMKSMEAYLHSCLNHAPNLMREESWKLLFQEQADARGRQTGMALSWFTGTLKGNSYFCHAGGGGGYYCEVRLYPALKLGSVLFMNRSGFKDERLQSKLDEPCLP